ncbi:MAG: hypothetical protein GC204_14805 [Chloroflexi bacterium]|nr:hypothetical protein [Chloroflexota bacterium]
MVAERKLHTVADFEIFITQSENQGRLFELIDGEIVEKMPTEEHGVLAARFAMRFGLFVEDHDLGWVAVEARYRAAGDTKNDRLPDVSFTSKSRKLPLVTQGVVPQLPDLAIEIQSPDDKVKDMRAKVDYYLANGVRMVLLVYPRQRLIEVCTLDDIVYLTENDTFDGGDVLPGFTLLLKLIFK